jgi:hypothetical protein
MPRKNGTGPAGAGPMTGRGNGKCIIPLNTKKEEMAFLKNQENVLRKSLEQIETRIAALK